MIGDHVAQRPGGFVKTAAMLDAHGLRGGDLHVIDVVAIPERLDDVVGKAEHHQVLHRLFAEVVVDAVNLFLRQDLLQVLVKLARRVQIVSKGFLHDHPGPVIVFFLGQPGLPELL